MFLPPRTLHVRSARLPRFTSDHDTGMAIVSGWGLLSQTTGAGTSKLRAVQVPLMSNQGERIIFFIFVSKVLYCQCFVTLERKKNRAN